MVRRLPELLPGGPPAPPLALRRGPEAPGRPRPQPPDGPPAGPRRRRPALGPRGRARRKLRDSAPILRWARHGDLLVAVPSRDRSPGRHPPRPGGQRLTDTRTRIEPRSEPFGLDG